MSRLYLCIIYEWITLSHRHESIPYSATLKYDTIIMQNCLFRLKLKDMLLCQTKHTLYLLMHMHKLNTCIISAVYVFYFLVLSTNQILPGVLMS